MHGSPSSRILLVFLLLGASAGLAACASGGGSSDGPRRDANRISAEELAPYTSFNAMDAVRRLRPNWLTSRGTGGPRIVVDGSPRGSVDVLSSLSVSDIQSMQMLNASDATMRYGTNYTGGAIVVISRGR